MGNELIRRAVEGQAVSRRDRRQVRLANQVVEQVRLSALQADGAMAMGAHLMEGLTALNDYRMSLSHGDPVIEALNLEIMSTTVRQAKSIQNGLYNDWGI